MQAAFLWSRPPVRGDAVLTLALCASPPRVLIGMESGDLYVYPLPISPEPDSQA